MKFKVVLFFLVIMKIFAMKNKFKILRRKKNKLNFFEISCSRLIKIGIIEASDIKYDLMDILYPSVHVSIRKTGIYFFGASAKQLSEARCDIFKVIYEKEGNYLYIPFDKMICQSLEFSNHITLSLKNGNKIKLIQVEEFDFMELNQFKAKIEKVCIDPLQLDYYITNGNFKNN